MFSTKVANKYVEIRVNMTFKTDVKIKIINPIM